MRRFTLCAFGALVTLAACSPPATIVAQKPASIDVAITAETTPDTPDARLPLTFDIAKAQEFTLHLKVLNGDGSVHTEFDGHDAWVRLSVTPGQIVSVTGPAGASDPDVAAANVHLHNGESGDIKVKLSGVYGDARIIAEDVGYVPAPDGQLSQCTDGVDNDKNGLSDYPVDPGCLFLNDDSESPPNGTYGTSRPIYYSFPRIHDVQGPGTTPFSGKQVELPGQDPVHMVVSALTQDGMYVTDLEDDYPAPHTPAFNSIFIYNFNPPPEIHVCDRITRLDGNVSIFVGAIQLGTAAWSKQPWLNPDASGPCPLPDFYEITDAIAGLNAQMQPLQGRLIKLVNPVIGPKFGPKVATGGKIDVGQSNCDLNGDGIAGCIASKPGFKDDENACCQTCYNDPDCTEWNDYTAHAQVKVHFGDANGTLFAKFSQVADFDPRAFTGPGVLKELRGVMSTFLLPAPLPSYAINPRCRDDVVLATDDPAEVHDVKSACVCYRTDPFSECTY